MNQLHFFFGESNLHRATSQFVLHYRQERNHQGLENQDHPTGVYAIPD
jgi:hypothetical protein